MFIGGCAGSTACGIKIFRFQVLFSAVHSQFQRLLQPHGVFVPHYNHRPIADDVVQSVMHFFFLFIGTFAPVALALGALGLDYMTAITGAATAICNVGPAMGPIIGPSGNFALWSPWWTVLLSCTTCWMTLFPQAPAVELDPKTKAPLHSLCCASPLVKS